ncbi:hypothetical protein MMC09_003992 [Bachmanniomyces sp. S44760]|nr:hypothetical protein [Bachmanniomyces sp. S44760]
MFNFIGLSIVAVLIAYGINCYLAFARNLAAAKASNIPYVIIPIYHLNVPWAIIQAPFLRLLGRLPRSWTHPTLNVSAIEWVWENLTTPFTDIGSDTFLTVSPGGNALFCADASVITQITTRRNDFLKPTLQYRILDIYGKNVVSTEGAMWRQHRKITSPPFTEKNNHLVWAESLHQAQAMTKSWLDNDEKRDVSETISTVAADAMRLSLHVISRAGFGVRLQWPGVDDGQPSQNDKEEAKVSEFSGDVPSIGMAPDHTMTYTDTLGTLLHSIIWVLLLPPFLLRWFPYPPIRKAYQAYVEWGRYMQEMFEAKKAQMAAGETQEGMDLMGALVKGAGITPNLLEKGQDQIPNKQQLSDSDILGNAFVFILAGHETSANSIHFSLLYLALYPSSQKALQQSLDSIFGDRPISKWDYESDVTKLFGSMAGAVLNEELRLVPPVINIPKHTLPGNPQRLEINGKECLVPGGCLVNLSCAVVQRNKKYWPVGPPPSNPKDLVHPTSNTDSDLEDFRPERWLVDTTKGNNNSDDTKEDSTFATAKDKVGASKDEMNTILAPDTHPSLYRPPRGSYIPFSDGHRACLGRRFAQVEVLAVLAVIFTQYSVELAVDDFATSTGKKGTDENVAGMTSEEKREVWIEARDHARFLIRHDMASVITLQMRKGLVKLRFVRRGKGKEVFMDV